MNIGIVGFGLMGKQRASDIKKMQGRHRLVAVADVNNTLAQRHQKEYGYAILPDWQALVERKDIDAVLVAVPHIFAKDIVIGALARGKHTLCEKPMGRNAYEARQILEAGKRYNRRIEPGFNYRFYPGIQKVVEVLRQNVLGEVTHARCVLGHGGRPGMEKEWKMDRELCGGGALLDPSIHIIDLFRFLLGEITEGVLWKDQAFWKTGVEDNAFLLLKTEKNQILSVHSSITEWKNLFRVEIFGTEGYCVLTGRSNRYGPQEVRVGKRWFWLAGEEEQVWKFSGQEDSFFLELQAFLSATSGDTHPSLATPEDGVRALEIVDHLYKGNAMLKR